MTDPARPTIEPPEIKEVDTLEVACDGDEGALGHPRVWLSLAGGGAVDCPYCDRRFVLRKGAGEGAH